jgi:site-specific DNA recombinase
MQKRAIGYTRRSSDKQEDNTSGATQEEKIREYIASIGYECIGVEHEIQSGADGLDVRPVLQKIRDRLRNGEADALVVYMVGRATRAGGIYALFLAHECSEAGVELHFANDGGKVDITTLVGQLTLLLKGDQAKEERNHLLEAMESGRRARAEKLGIPVTGPRSRFGFELLDMTDPATGQLRRKARAIINESQAAIVRRVFVLYHNSMSPDAIATLFNSEHIPTVAGGRWARNTIRNIIRDTRYIGIGYSYVYRNERLGYKRYKQVIRPIEERVRIDGFWPPIVDGDLFYACQERMDHAAQEAAQHNSSPESYLLRGGFVVCGVCGHVMVGKAAHFKPGPGHHGNLPRYRCNPKQTNTQCSHPTIATHFIDDFVKHKIWHLANNPDEAIHQLQEVHHDEGNTLVEDLERYRKMAIQIREREKRYIRMLDLAVDAEQEEEVHAQLVALANQRKDADAEVLRLERQVEAQQKSKQTLENVRKLLEQIAAGIDNANYEEWRDIIRAFGVLVTVYPKAGYDRRFRVKMDIPGEWDEEASIANTSAHQ